VGAGPRNSKRGPDLDYAAEGRRVRIQRGAKAHFRGSLLSEPFTIDQAAHRYFQAQMAAHSVGGVTARHPGPVINYDGGVLLSQFVNDAGS